MGMFKMTAAALMCGGLLLGGAVVGDLVSSNTSVLAQKGKAGKGTASVRALKKEIAAEALKRTEKYLKDNPGAADLGAAYTLAIESARDSGNLKALKTHGEAAAKALKDDGSIGDVMEVWATAMAAKAPIKDAAAAVELAAPMVTDLRAKVGLYQELAQAYGFAGDSEKAMACFDTILGWDAISTNAANKKAIEDMKKPYEHVGKAFEHFEATGFDDKPLNSADYKGKYVFIDFWATWCGPCVREMPNVIANYNRFNAKGFDVIGISLDDGSRGGKEALTDYIAKHNLKWRQYYDGGYWQTKLFLKYKDTFGIGGIPFTLLLDKEGKILAVNLRGEQLGNALERLLGDG